MDRRTFFKISGFCSASLLTGGNSLIAGKDKTPSQQKRPNILFVTFDDMSYDSAGCMGNPMPDITPNIDELAQQGIIFTHGHNSMTICGPSRASFFTGLYPSSNGKLGHGKCPPQWWKQEKGDRKITDLSALLNENGYFTGLIEKSASRFSKFDYKNNKTAFGRDPALFHKRCTEFLNSAKSEDKPFFLNVNMRDPHRYWAGAPNETQRWIQNKIRNKEKLNQYPNGKPWPDPEREYTSEEVVVPPAYPDDPDIRKWLTYYYGSVKRGDMCLEATLKALRQSGQEDNTIIVAVFDHGLGWAYSKWSLYPSGTRTPIIFKWPGRIKPGQTDATHVVSTVDIMPTLLEAVGMELPNAVDGKSLMPLIEEGNCSWNRSEVFCSFDFQNRGKNEELHEEYSPELASKLLQYRPMRALHSLRYTYIWNAWADGKNKVPRDMGAQGVPMQILQEKAGNQPDTDYPDYGERAKFYLYRTPEELYDTTRDPGCLNNLIDDPAYKLLAQQFRRKMMKTLERIDDHELENYRKIIR
jgi:N-sulfoglucosamine sulfohydrolase